MATSKVKGTSKKIKELKGIKPEKISEEHLRDLQDKINNLNRSQIEIGSMEVRKHEILHDIAGKRDELTLLQDKFEKEYGTYDVNIHDGTINYPKENGEVNKKN